MLVGPDRSSSLLFSSPPSRAINYPAVAAASLVRGLYPSGHIVYLTTCACVYDLSSRVAKRIQILPSFLLLLDEFKSPLGPAGDVSAEHDFRLIL